MLFEFEVIGSNIFGFDDEDEGDDEEDGDTEGQSTGDEGYDLDGEDE